MSSRDLSKPQSSITLYYTCRSRLVCLKATACPQQHTGSSTVFYKFWDQRFDLSLKNHYNAKTPAVPICSWLLDNTLLTLLSTDYSWLVGIFSINNKFKLEKGESFVVRWQIIRSDNRRHIVAIKKKGGEKIELSFSIYFLNKIL